MSKCAMLCTGTVWNKYNRCLWKKMFLGRAALKSCCSSYLPMYVSKKCLFSFRMVFNISSRMLDESSSTATSCILDQTIQLMQTSSSTIRKRVSQPKASATVSRLRDYVLLQSLKCACWICPTATSAGGSAATHCIFGQWCSAWHCFCWGSSIRNDSSKTVIR